MPDTQPRAALVEGARVILQIAAQQPARADLTADEFRALYGVLKGTRDILLSYTVVKNTPELRAGAKAAGAKVQGALWVLESSWLDRYTITASNVTPFPLGRTG
jgi:hypothetical protein